MQINLLNQMVKMQFRLLIAVALVCNSCKPLVREPAMDLLALEQEKQRNKLLKAAAVVGVAALAVFGGQKLWKTVFKSNGAMVVTEGGVAGKGKKSFDELNKELGAKVMLREEEKAIAARSQIATFTKADLSNPPLYRLINTRDGSEHYLLGTMHKIAIILDDFPPNSKILSTLEESTVFIPEVADSPISSLQKAGMNIVNEQQKKLEDAIYSGYDFRTELGEKHWEKLVEQLGISDARLLRDTSWSAASAQGRLVDKAVATIAGKDGAMMDAQITRIGKEGGKKVIGLESYDEAASMLHNVGKEAENSLDMNSLRALIDKGGEKYVQDNFIKTVNAYGRGDIQGMENHLSAPLATRG